MGKKEKEIKMYGEPASATVAKASGIFKHSVRKIATYEQAWQQSVRALEADPLTKNFSESEMQSWVKQASGMVNRFHRSSSAVEGRNGRLSQMYHNGRGFSERRLSALTVIHNYGIRHKEGLTAASRLFAREFSDPLTWLLGKMGELPPPRSSRQRKIRNPLILLDVPA